MALLRRLLFITIAIAAFVYLYQQRSLPGVSISETSDPTAEQRKEPDVYLRDATITEFQQNGERKYELYAQSMDRFDDEAVTVLDQPRLDLQTDSSPWDIEADRGNIRQQLDDDGNPQDLVYLNDNVRLTQLGVSEDIPKLTIRSSAFTIHPDREYAETDQDVMIDTSVGRTTANGMTGDLRTGMLFLTSIEAEQHGEQTELRNTDEASAFEVSAPDDERVHTIVLPQQFKDKNKSSNEPADQEN